MPKSYGERIGKLKEQREKIERRLNTLEQKATNKKVAYPPWSGDWTGAHF